MQRRVAVIALLVGAAAIALIVVLSGGGDDDKAATPASAPTEERGDASPGPAGATGSERQSSSGAGGSDSAAQRARRRALRKTRSRRGPRRQEQGRLGQTGGSPAQGERLDRDRPGAAVATITLVGGAPVGGVQRVRFPKDERVRLIVRSDTNEVVEISGYGLTRRVRAAGSARFYFETSKKGLFSIELTRGQTRIGVLSVG